MRPPSAPPARGVKTSRLARPMPSGPRDGKAGHCRRSFPHARSSGEVRAAPTLRTPAARAPADGRVGRPARHACVTGQSTRSRAGARQRSPRVERSAEHAGRLPRNAARRCVLQYSCREYQALVPQTLADELTAVTPLCAPLSRTHTHTRGAQRVCVCIKMQNSGPPPPPALDLLPYR